MLAERQLHPTAIDPALDASIAFQWKGQRQRPFES
jgi:hypothetical protein